MGRFQKIEYLKKKYKNKIPEKTLQQENPDQEQTWKVWRSPEKRQDKTNETQKNIKTRKNNKKITTEVQENDSTQEKKQKQNLYQKLNLQIEIRTRQDNYPSFQNQPPFQQHPLPRPYPFLTLSQFPKPQYKLPVNQTQGSNQITTLQNMRVLRRGSHLCKLIPVCITCMWVIWVRLHLIN